MKYVWPKNEVSETSGNIYQIPTNLKPNYKIIDVPDTVIINSLTISKSGNLWVSLDNKKQRKIEYIQLDRKKLLHFIDGKWLDLNIEKDSSFLQVEFIPYTVQGYVITEKGEVYETKNEGIDWDKLELTSIRLMHSTPNLITFLKGKNILISLMREI